MDIGHGLLIPVEAFGDVGLFDGKRFPQGSSDTDFTLRAREEGYTLAVDLQSVIYNRPRISVDFEMKNSTTWRTFFTPLFTQRSYDNISTRRNLLVSYWPVLLIPIALVNYYMIFTIKQTLRIVRRYLD